MNAYYTSERNIQILISLMKAHKVRKVIASPGSTNISFVASIQQDSYFEIYSAPDERSAAYIACGMAASSGEPVALSCTGATASRNYIPGLTEAFYRKLPVLAITSTQHMGKIGHHIAQVIDRTAIPNDIANLSVQIPIIHDAADEWAVEVSINKALLELRHRGGGPVHINMTTSYPIYPVDFSVKHLPPARSIFRICHGEEQPKLPVGRIAVFVGSHTPWSKRLLGAVEKFCQTYDAVVLCDHTSNYHGDYGVSAALMLCQDYYRPTCREIRTLIHIGEVSGAYLSLQPQEVWRVNPDGEIRDTFSSLKYVFEMEEAVFFESYVREQGTTPKQSFAREWKDEYSRLLSKVPKLPLSNIWIARETLNKLPDNSILHLGILNSLRSWNFFPLRKDMECFCNTGGFGIDGLMSSMLGSALARPDRLHFLVIGDLAFFYDMNVLGNRHIGNNVRILLINNGKGTEFRNYTNFASGFGADADTFIAAGGHYGNQSPDLVRHYAEDLGFEYMCASSQEEYQKTLDRFTALDVTEKPMLLEAFTTNEDEDNALRIMRNLEVTQKDVAKQVVKNIVKDVIGDKSLQNIKNMLR